MAHNVVVFADGEDKDIFSVYVAAVEKKVSNHWRACQEMADKEAAANSLPFFSRRAAMKAIRKQYSRVPTYRTRFSCIVGLLPQEKEGFFNYFLSYDPYYLYAVKADEELKKLGHVSVPLFVWQDVQKKGIYGCQCNVCSEWE